MKRPLFLVLLILLTVNVFLAFYYFRLRSGRQTESPKSSFFCPVPEEYCSGGKIIEVEGNYLGIGYQIPEGTPIMAVLAGQVKGGGVSFQQSVGGGRFPSLDLADFTSGFKAYYVLTGEDYQGLANIKRGDEILTARPGEIAGFGVNLLVSVTDNSQKKLKLEVKDFSTE